MMQTTAWAAKRDRIVSRQLLDTLILGVANSYARDLLQDRLSSTARRVLAGIAGRPVDIVFTVSSQ
jgi:hypothetical protein